MNWVERFPTLKQWFAKRELSARNQLPKHLRPEPLWPLAVQLLINLSLIVTLIDLMMNKDDYLTEAGPAIAMVICLVFLIAAVVQSIRLKRRFAVGRGARLAKFNFFLMIIAFLCWPLTVAIFL